MNKRQFSRRTALALAASAGLMSMSHASGQVNSATVATWTGNGTPATPANYVDGINWSTLTAPTNTTPSVFAQINDAGTAIVNTFDSAQGTFLNLGVNTSDSGNLVIHGGSLTVGELHVGGRETVPNDFTNFGAGSIAVAGGTGTVVQDGGDVAVTYNAGGEPPVDSLFVGDGGVTGVANGNSGNGSYNISGGTLTVGINASDNGIFIGTGSGSVGTFIQSGATLSTSTVTSTTAVVVARAGATAGYAMSGGTLNVGTLPVAPSQNLWVGDGGSVDGLSTVAGTVGSFTQSGGAVIVKTNTEIGRRTGTGSYSISGGTLLSGTTATTDSILVGSGTGSIGSFSQSGSSTVTATGNLLIGAGAGTGSYSISSGSVQNNTAGDAIYIGTGVGSIGSFTQSGATTATSTVTSFGSMQVGRAGGTGNYSLSGGTLNISTSGTTANPLLIGNGSTGNTTSAATFGTFTQTGGAVSIQNNGYVTVGSSGGTGIYALSNNGTLNINNNSLIVGDGASGNATVLVPNSVGTFTQTGGAVTLQTTTTANTLDLGKRGGTGVYTMSAGTLSVLTSMNLGNGTSAFPSGNGTFNVSGSAQVTLGTNLVLANGVTTVGTTNTGLSGLLSMSGGSITFNAPGAIWAIGNAYEASGTANISGGSIVMNGATALTDVGRGNSTGALTISGTSLTSTTVSVTEFLLDSAALLSGSIAESRTLEVDGGTFNVGFWEMGGGATAATRSVTITGGAVNVTSPTAVDRGGKAVTYTLSGGSLSFANSISFDTSPVTLSGATLSGTTLTSGTALFSYSAGTLNASTAFVLSSGGTFKSDNASTLSLSGVVNFSLAGNATINVNSGTLAVPNLLTNAAHTLTKSGLGVLTISGNQANTGAAVITVSNGTLNLNSNANGGVVGAGLLTVNANSTTNFGSSQGLATVNVGSGAVATLTENPTPRTTNKVINVTNVGTIAGKLDLTNNKLITTTTAGVGASYTGVTALVKSGRNTGNWDGNGITTSESAAKLATNLTTLAVATGQDVTGAVGAATANWAGQVVHGTDTLVMYTYNGDANLDGRVNADDYFVIDSNYNKSGTVFGFAKGDFNYDGLINGDDYTKIDAGFAGQAGVQFAHGPDLGGGLAGVSAVPEPAGLSMFAIASVGMLRRRRRR